MTTETSKQKLELTKAQNKYLEASKEYSKVLSNSLKLDKNILKIAQEIAVTGEQISIHDNKFLTEFTTRLSKNSHIDKKYHHAVLDLKKAKSVFDNASFQLMRARVDFVLTKAGLSAKKHTLSNTELARIINNPKTSPLEKISIGLPMLKDEASEFEGFIDSGEIVFENGVIKTGSKTAREFIRSFDAKVKKLINDQEYSSTNSDIVRGYVAYYNDANGLLDLLRIAGDEDHVRELERKLSAGDVYVSNSQIIPVNPKGERYVRLLTEELGDLLEKKVTKEFLRRNKSVVDNDQRLSFIRSQHEILKAQVGKHKKHLDIVGVESKYADLIQRADTTNAEIESMIDDLLGDIESISLSYAEIKKQLVVLVSKKEAETERYLSLLAALKLLAKHEQGLDNKIDELSRILKSNSTTAVKRGPRTIDEIGELYPGLETGDDESYFKSVVTGTNDKRADFGRQVDKITTNFILNSPNYSRYVRVMREQELLKRYLSDELLNSESLYSGIHDTSHLVVEIVELDIEKRELVADIQHEIELVHKKLWCQEIGESNQKYLDTNFPEIDPASRKAALRVNRDLVGGVNTEIADVIDSYSMQHSQHASEFNIYLSQIGRRIDQGDDVLEIAADIKARYATLIADHNAALESLDQEMKRLDTYLSEFKKGSRKQLEKTLITDIKNRL